MAQGHNEVPRTEIQNYLSSGDTENRRFDERWLEDIDYLRIPQRLFSER
jgi:hypothetical protein